MAAEVKLTRMFMGDQRRSISEDAMKQVRSGNFSGDLGSSDDVWRVWGASMIGQPWRASASVL